jgi:hypothetical protein
VSKSYFSGYKNENFLKNIFFFVKKFLNFYKPKKKKKKKTPTPHPPPKKKTTTTGLDIVFTMG